MNDNKIFNKCYEILTNDLQKISDKLAKNNKNLNKITITTDDKSQTQGLFELEGDIILEEYDNKKLIKSKIGNWLFEPTTQRIVLTFQDDKNSAKKYGSNPYGIEYINHLNKPLFKEALDHMDKINKVLKYPYEISLQRPVIFIDAEKAVDVLSDLYVLEKSFVNDDTFRNHISDGNQFKIKSISNNMDTIQFHDYLNQVSQKFLTNLYDKDIEKLTAEELETIKMYMN